MKESWKEGASRESFARSTQKRFRYLVINPQYWTDLSKIRYWNPFVSHMKNTRKGLASCTPCACSALKRKLMYLVKNSEFGPILLKLDIGTPLVSTERILYGFFERREDGERSEPSASLVKIICLFFVFFQISKHPFQMAFIINNYVFFYY